MTASVFAPYFVTYNDDTSWSLSSLAAISNATAVLFAFGNLTGTGSNITVDMGNSSFQKYYTESQLNMAIYALHQAGVKAILSINDSADGAGETHWSDINTSALATSFANNVAGIVQNWGFDGVDLDNEDMGGPSYFGNIVPALRTALGADAWISAPVYDMNEGNLDLSTTASYFNFVQTMNYSDAHDIESYVVALIKRHPALSGKVLAGIGTPDAASPQFTPLQSIPTLAAEANVSGFSLWAVNYPDAGPYLTAIESAMSGTAG